MEEAVQLMVSKRVQNIEKYNGFRSQMIDILKKEEVQFFINGKLEHTLPNILNISFPGTTAESILMNLDIAGIAASSGSACTAGALKPSHVLIAMYGEEDERIKNAIRFSFGMTNTEQEILKVAKQVSQIVKRITK
jgi:cysteine desulfurase